MKKFGDLKKGDTIYLIDEKNDYQIKPLKIKKITSYYDGNGYDIEGGITEFFNKTWSRSGLFCTEEKIATDFVEKVIKKKKLFATLKPGDVFYAINRKNSSVIVKLTVIKNDPNDFDIYVNSSSKENIGVSFSEHQYYSTSAFDDFWKVICDEWGEFENAEGLFINKEDITTYFTKLEEKRKKKSIDKYVFDLSNHGKPISFLDNKGNQLHYGDKVAYVRRNGLYAHTDISFGIVTGESKTKIKILDEEELKVGKPNTNWWNREAGQFIKSDGLHALEPQNVVFISSVEKKVIEFGK
jgi:hypothetical protein